MASSHEELIQSFQTARSYIRSFFIYGYKRRSDFLENKNKDNKQKKGNAVTSSTYADYLRRIDNWLNSFSHSTRKDKTEYVHFLKLDAHEVSSNPFYMPLKTRSFKSIQMTMHFYLMDLLREHPEGVSKTKILHILNNDYFYKENVFDDYIENDSETILQHYVDQKLINYDKNSKTYSFADSSLLIKALIPNEQYTLDTLMDEEGFICFYQNPTPESVAAELSTVDNIIKFSNGNYSCKAHQPISLFCEQKIGTGSKAKFVPKEYTKEEMLNILDNNYSEIYPSSVITEDQLRYILDEYVKLGLLRITKNKPLTYVLNSSIHLTDDTLSAIQYFSEAGNIGFFGSTLLDLQEEQQDSPFVFKHHYIAQAINTEIVYQLLDAIYYHKLVNLNLCKPNNTFIGTKNEIVLPLKIYRSTDSGRTYLLAYYCSKQRYDFFMLDNVFKIKDVTTLPEAERLGRVKAEIQKPDDKKILCCINFDEILKDSDSFTKYIWSMSTTLYKEDYPQPTGVEVVFHIGSNEFFIKNRLEREKRQGQLIYDDEAQTATYTIKLFNPGEMFPWLRSYITRIESISFEDKALEEKFFKDIQCMNSMYDIYREEEKNV